MNYKITLQKRGYGKEEHKKQLKKAKKKKVNKRRNKYIVVCGMVMQEPKCGICNYNECETCPTWHGEGSAEVIDNE